ncbi:MAG: hypothetical protein HY815_13965 [Candidatus Riflebacteria bacterium]|nr:hypothetical protein [Candidatus Riflebacteria bacterium]
MKRSLWLILWLAPIAAAAAAAAATGQPDLDSDHGLMQEAKSLRRDINLHNLYNGLNLSVDQLKKLVALAREAESCREAAFGAGNDRAAEVVQTYRKIVDVVSRGERIPKSLEGLGGLMELAEKRIRRQYFEKMAALESRAHAVLSLAQQQVLESFEPCLIPPVSLKDPVRAGQAHSTDEGRKVLELARGLPEATFEPECRRALDLHLSMLERFLGKMDRATRERQLDRMLEVCRRARGLSPVDFSVDADRLSVELALDRQKTVFKAKAEEFLGLIRGVQGGAIGKVAKHFLDPAAIPILEARIARAGQPPEPQAAASVTNRPAEPLEPGKKYAVSEICRRLGLDGTARDRFVAAAREAKADKLRVLQTPLADGTVPLAQFLKARGLAPSEREAAMRAMFVKLQEPYPGKDDSPMERLLAIRTRFDQALGNAVTPAQHRAIAALAEDPIDGIELADQGKPALSELTRKLELTRAQVERFESALEQGQTGAFTVLSIPDPSGKKPLEMIMAAQAAGPDRKREAFEAFVKAVQQPVPGRLFTYQDRVTQIKGKLDADLRALLSARQYQELVSMQIDLLEIQADQ